MIVAVQKELKTLASDLCELGFDIVTYGKYRYPIDAIVYANQSFIELKNCNFPEEGGVLMVNAANKSTREVAEILSKGLYEPLI